jgi:hypothetical protein
VLDRVVEGLRRAGQTARYARSRLVDRLQWETYFDALREPKARA